MSWAIHQGDIIDWLDTYDGPKFHAAFGDPPYNLHFMGKKFDTFDSPHHFQEWCFRWATALLDVLHPGAFVMFFGGSRTYHRLACALEDAGFVSHGDLFGWGYAQGFPKATKPSHHWRDMRGVARLGPNRRYALTNEAMRTMSLQDRLRYYRKEKRLKGWVYGLQSLKPSLEPVLLFQKPYAGKPVEDITANGAGALNVDGGRIEAAPSPKDGWRPDSYDNDYQYDNDGIFLADVANGQVGRKHTKGRWPANLLLTHARGCRRIGTRRIQTYRSGVDNEGKSESSWFGTATGRRNMADPDGTEVVATWDCVEDCAVRALAEQSGETGNSYRENRDNHKTVESDMFGVSNGATPHNDTGTAARYFHQSHWHYEVAEQLARADSVRYESKSSRRERNAGLDGFEAEKVNGKWGDTFARGRNPNTGERTSKYETMRRNHHPTVKPISLAKYLCQLLLPPPAYAPRRILVPFCGSGSEMIGAHLAGWDHIHGVEMDAEYVAIAEARLAFWQRMAQQAGTTDVDALLDYIGEIERAEQERQERREQGQMTLWGEV